ncbi:endonuclease domain-containing protein [Streptomyces albicerus]|uniref:endonuclease domain-containing protein n=1 Tax=Streptomyces albicerus TaxID=2569859 RepID=UPI00124B3D4E
MSSIEGGRVESGRLCVAEGSGWACGRSSERHTFTGRLCSAHYAQLRRGRDLAPIKSRIAEQASYRPCQFDGCGRAVRATGLCTAHYNQRRAGRPLSPLRKRRDNGVYRAMVESGIIACLGCGENKPVSEYSVLNAAGAPRPYCKPCNAERVRLSHYNVTKEFLELLLRYQGGNCAVCGTADAGGRGVMHIDHDHACCPGRRSCGECVRALVCTKCNLYGLAWYESLPPSLRTFDWLNSYIHNPPAKRLREELAAPLRE